MGRFEQRWAEKLRRGRTVRTRAGVGASVPRRVRTGRLLPLAGWFLGTGVALAVTGCCALAAPFAVAPEGVGPDQAPTDSATATAIPADSIVELNRALEDAGLGWQARYNDILALTPDERARRYGVRLDDKTLRTIALLPTPTRTPLPPATAAAPSAPTALSASGLPDSLDYRPYAPPVRDQGPCGSCWAFASLGAVETEMRRRDPALAVDFDLSEQRLVSCHPGSCGGYYVDAALEFLRTDGTYMEACDPYRAVDDRRYCSAGCADPVARLAAWQDAVPPSRVCSLTPYLRPESWNVSVARALWERGPLVAVMSVPSDFGAYAKGVYRYSGFFGPEAAVGCHAVTLMGYDARERYWIVRNSWGTGWGDNGYALVSWDDDRTHLGGLLYWVDPLGMDAAVTATATATPSPATTVPTQPSPPSTPTVTDQPATATPTNTATAAASVTPSATATARPATPTATPTASASPPPYPGPYPPPYPGPLPNPEPGPYPGPRPAPYPPPQDAG